MYLDTILFTLAPYASFFLGIVIRKVALPGPNSPKLGKQLLLGVPVALVVVTPLLAAFYALMPSLPDDAWKVLPSILLTLGTIMEQGMIVMETATKLIERALGQLNSGGTQSAPPSTPAP